jgi:1-carboxybiuret hydrolase
MALMVPSIGAINFNTLDGTFFGSDQPYAIPTSKFTASLLDASDEVQLPNAALPKARLRTDQSELKPLSVDRFITVALSPAQWYLKGQSYRRHFRDDALKHFEQHVILLAPATPVSAPVIGTEWIEASDQKMPCR